MIRPEDRRLFRSKDPIVFYQQIMTALDGEPGPLLTMAASKNPAASQYARDRIKEKLGTLCTERLFLDFMKWVDRVKTEYRPFVEAGAVLSIHEASYQDICGYWFNKDLVSYRQLWSTYIAGKRLRDGTMPPPEMFDAVATCPAEAQEMMYDAKADAHDRTATRRATIQ